jgi:hypothetical protein
MKRTPTARWQQPTLPGIHPGLGGGERRAGDHAEGATVIALTTTAPDPNPPAGETP